MCTGDEAPVFFTSPGGGGGGTTLISFVKAGLTAELLIEAEEESVFVLSVGFLEDTGGWFIGRLEIVFTTLSRFCACDAPVKPTDSSTTHTARNPVFFKIIKTITPIFVSIT